jgi:hypothetical protein
MKRARDESALTEAEIAFLRSDRTPVAVRRFVARQHESIGVRTTAYRKVANAARAERDALIEIAALEVVHGVRHAASDFEAEVAALKAERDALAREVGERRRQLRQTTASPALAVYAE